MLVGAAMPLSPVPGSPAEQQTSRGSLSSLVKSTSSGDFYAHAKHRLGTLTMSSPRPSKRNKFGTPRSSSRRHSCASTIRDDDDMSEDDSLSADAGRAEEPQKRQLFAAGSEDSFPRNRVYLEEQTTTNVNPFAPPPPPPFRCDSVDPSVDSFRSSSKPSPPLPPEKKSHRGGGDEEDEMQESRFEHDFEVVKVVGKGSFGTVHKVKSRVDGVHYAVKSARARFKGKSHREHTMKEVYALAALSAESDHEGARHVVRYYHAWIEDERLYIQTELCDASLEKRLSKGPLLSRDVWNFLRQLLLALDFLHSKQIVHLDIKPDNIFVNFRDTDVYKLGDFGLVARSNDGDVVEGDSRYMSKELLEDDDLIFAARAEGRGPAKKDLTKCDIFSLGATTYEICRGEGKPLPPNGPEWHALRNEQLVFAPSQQRETPLDLQRCIATMMLSDPSLRPTASALLSDHPALQSKVQQLTHQLERERHHVAQFRNQLISLSQPHRLSRSNTWA